MWDQVVRFGNEYTDRLLQNMGHWASDHALNVAIIVLCAHLARRFGGQMLVRVINRTIRPDLFPTETARKKRVQTLDGLVLAVTRLGVWLVAGIMIINELGINTAPLLASASVLGLALGIGAQSLIKDFVSGIFIITENQYRVGDVVSLNDIGGVVEAITIRTTILRDLDGNLHHIPNGTVSVTTNKTIGFSSVNENITVPFTTDMAKLEHIINHIGEQISAMPEYQPKIIEPVHFSNIVSLTATGVEIKILARTLEGEQWAVKNEFYSRLKRAFERNDIVIAPTSSIIIRNVSPTKRS